MKKKKKCPHYLKHRAFGQNLDLPGQVEQNAFCFRDNSLLSLPAPYSPPRAIFLLAGRLQNDKFSTLKKDFRCLRGTFCAALSFRLLFASLVLYLPLTLRPLSSLSHPSLSLSLSLTLLFSFLTYLLSFLARSLHPSLSLSPSSVALAVALLPPLPPCKFTMPSLVISGCALRSRL